MPSNATFAGLSAAPGEKVTGYLDVVERPASSIRWPVGLINGASDGPRLSITGGVHGTEYVGMEAAIRSFHSIDPRQLRGAIGFVFVVNVPGFEAAETFANPMDGQNLNRIFPGNQQGTVSFVMAHRLVELLSNWGQWHLDLHGGDASEWLNPFAIYHQVENDEVNRVSEQMARLWDTEIVWATGHQFTYPGTLVGELSGRGIPSIVAESGYLSTYNEPEIGVHTTGVRNVLRSFGLLDGEPELRNQGRQKVVTENWVASTTRGGIFHPRFKPGDRIHEGDILAEIKNVFGEVVEQIRGPKTGLIRIQHPRRVVTTGSPVFRGWVIQD
jgi:predicted deacylase